MRSMKQLSRHTQTNEQYLLTEYMYIIYKYKKKITKNMIKMST